MKKSVKKTIKTLKRGATEKNVDLVRIREKNDI